MSSIPPNVPGIYQITCTPTGKIYIGSAKKLRKRWQQHRAELSGGYHINSHLQHAWGYYGAGAFVFEILELVMFPEYLIEREQHYLDTLRPYEHAIGFNMAGTAGSMLGYTHSPEVREKLRKLATGRKHSAEARQKMSEAHKGTKFTAEHRQNMGMAGKGRKHSEASRQKISAATKGRKYSPESYKKGAEKRRGLRQSAETRQKMSEAASNRSPETLQRMAEAQRRRDPKTFFPIAEVMRGRQITDEEHERRSEAARRRIAVPRHIVTIIATGEEILVHLPSFCAENNLSCTCMRSTISGRQKTHKGYVARRAPK